MIQTRYQQSKKDYISINTNAIVLDKITQKFVDSVKSAPPIYEKTFVDARKVLDDLQKDSFDIPTKYEDIQVNFTHNFTIRIIKPDNTNPNTKIPVAIYYHGGGWILGNKNTHDRLVRELSYGSNIAIAFVEYTNSPEAQYNVIKDQCYYALEYIHKNGHMYGLDTTKMAIVGDSVGGNLSILMMLLIKMKGGPKIARLILLYPVTDAGMNTNSYNKFKDGPWLSAAGMSWFWDAYAPNQNRSDELLSPINASHEQLKDIPPTLIITDENDVLRDEGECFARKLMKAGVSVVAVRMIGTIHDFMMLNPLAESPITKGAINITCIFLKDLIKY